MLKLVMRESNIESQVIRSEMNVTITLGVRPFLFERGTTHQYLGLTAWDIAVGAI